MHCGPSPATWTCEDTTVAELGRPHAVRRIIIQEVSAHPEVRSRAAQLQDEVGAAVAAVLAALTGHAAPQPEHTTGARLLTTAAIFGPVVYDAPQIDPASLARLLHDGLPD